MRSYLADFLGQGGWILERSSQGPSYRLVLIAAVVVFLGIGALALAAAESGQAAYPGPGARIAFVREGTQGTEIFTAAADGTDEAPLTSGPGDREPTFSADGRRIAFNRRGAIATMKADGTKQQVLASGAESSPTTVTTYEEEVENPTTSEMIQFVKVETTTTTFTQYEHPSFSPDGSRIAVAQTNGNEVETFSCAVETASGTDCIEEGEPGGYESRESTCPDCTQNIVALDSSTGAFLGDLTAPSNDYFDEDPTYAADGEIAFDRTEPNTLQIGGGTEESMIYTLDSSGITTPVSPGPLDRQPDFSPDGSEIVFTEEATEELGFSAGGTVRSESIPGAPDAEATFVGSPIFSPDGGVVLFTREDENEEEEIETGVYSIPSAGGSPTLVVADAREPAWQPVVPAPEPPESLEPPATPAPPVTGSTGQDTTKPPATTPPVRGATVRVKHGRVKLDGKDQETVGSVACGTSTCTIAPVSATLRVGPIVKPSRPQPAKRCRATVVAPTTLAAGETASVAVRVGNATCLERLEARGMGKLWVVVRVSDASGTHMLSTHLTLLPKS
jgi:dipeptidyl aminopeptidase/acylaminoacyl peptidase